MSSLLQHGLAKLQNLVASYTQSFNRFFLLRNQTITATII